MIREGKLDVARADIEKAVRQGERTDLQHRDNVTKLDDDRGNARSYTLRRLAREHGVAGGKPGPGRGHKTADTVSRLRHGNRADYTLARLERDGRHGD